MAEFAAPTVRSDAASRARGSRIAAALITTPLASIVAGSAATAGLILGLARLPLVAFLGALTTAMLAGSRGRLRWTLPLTLLLGIPVSLVAAGWRPLQPVHRSLHQLGVMLRMIERGTAAGTTFPDFLFFLAIWASAAWLGWFAIRARRPLVAVVPPVAIVAIDVLNVPQGQVTFVLGLVLCCCALLLVTAYDRSLEQASRRGLRLHHGVRRRHWEMGVLVGILVLVIAAFVPPLSTVNRTLSWGPRIASATNQLQSSTQPNGGRVGTADANAVLGYTRNVRLLGPVADSHQIVFTYSTDLGFPGPYYFAGNTATDPAAGAWLPPDANDDTGVLEKDTELPWETPARSQLTAHFRITIRHPQRADPRTVFFPGQLEQVSIPTELLLQYGPTLNSIADVAQAKAANGIPRTYQVTASGSSATAGQLAAAGTAYPSWVRALAQPLNDHYLPRSVLNQIHELALGVISGTQEDAYDEATAIQNYLRENYTYTLRPKAVPAGEDALQAFLNHDTGGYCVYFATAMADMLRSLGIPVILVNGFGPGTFNPKTQRYVVRASDAHTWPEVYFPGYGWIAFEPTPQPGFGVIQRTGTTPGCPSDICGSGASGAGAAAPTPNLGHNELGPLGTGGAARARHGSGFPVVRSLLGGLLVLLLLALAWSVWWLRPRTLTAAWRRTSRLASLAGIPADRSESPLEFGRRLARTVPPVAGAALALAEQVTVAAYAPPGTARVSGPPPAWASVRDQLLWAAVRRGLRRGRLPQQRP